MEWWHWVLVVAVAFASFTWWISRLPGKRGNEEDFRAVTDTYLRKAAEYYEMADRANSLSSLRQIEKKLVVLAGDYIDMGKRFDLSQSQTAIDGNKAMSRIVHAVSNAVEGNEGALVTGRREKESALQEMIKLQKRVSALYDEAIDEMADGSRDVAVLKRNMTQAMELKEAAQLLADSPSLATDDLLSEFAYIQESILDMQRFVDSPEYK